MEEELGNWLACPHGESSESYSLHELLMHLEECPSPCNEGGDASKDPPSPSCGHLAKYDADISQFWDKQRCPHNACEEELPNSRRLPQHLEECQRSCDDQENGQCSHLFSLDTMLANILDHGPPQEPMSADMPMEDVKHRSPFSQPTSTSASARESSDIICPHDDCEQAFSGAVDEALTHLKSCDKPCGSTSNGCDHVNNIAMFCSEIAKRGSSTKEDNVREEDAIISEGQPPVFNPSEHLSPNELKEARKRHLQLVKKLTPEERKLRQVMRNRRTAKISKERRQKQIEQLKIENTKLRVALQKLYVSYMSLKQGSA
mmetsp:Transcript_12614/g.38618  ORF Transcript_12614/g.38618 Transcript_12614/m.38618 type:complete len:317 (+) Transcript_12614:58-1008(+)